MAQVDIKRLFEAGVHFGHRTSRWHPKMKNYIFGVRNHVHVIDLEKTVAALDAAIAFTRETAASGKQVLLVGTKRQAQDIVARMGQETGMPSVTVRWMGGMLTNHSTIAARIKHLKDLEAKMESGEFTSRYSKLEVQRFQEEIDQLNHIFGGVKELNGLPGALYVTDAVTEAIAIKEARRLGIPVIAIVDSNADPSTVDWPIPGNDDAIKSIEVISEYIAQAIMEGRAQHKDREAATKQANESKEPASAEAKE